MPGPTVLCIATLNARLMPLDRGDLFEDPLDEALQERKLGEVSGGGTGLSKEGEPEYSDIEVSLHGDQKEAIATITNVLEMHGAPKGSKLVLNGETTHFGKSEGLAIYLNGTDLPDEVYESSDAQFVYDEINRLIEGEGMVFSHWQGPTETALYAYGVSFESMKAKIAPLVESYPLCQKCRIVQIA